MPDSLSNLYAELLSDSYDCVDRIVLKDFSGVMLPSVVAGAERIGGDAGQYAPHAHGGSFQPSDSRLCKSESHSGCALFGRGA
jgi:hypothetical protein